MFFRKFHGFQGSSTIRSALWENAHPSLAAVGLLLATADLKTTLSALLVAAGEGNTELQTVPIVGRDIRDGQPDTEAELQAALIAMIPTPGGSHDEGGLLVRNLLAEFLRGFFITYSHLPTGHGASATRRLSCGTAAPTSPVLVSVELAQQKKRGQTGTRLQVTYQYEGVWLSCHSPTY